MDLNKLKTFCEVARLSSISRAAESLRRTQPAITHQIKLLEEELELALLDRRNARVFLTREGEQLYESARAKFQSLEDELAEIKADQKSIRGLIRIGIKKHLGNVYLPSMLENFHQQYSGARFHIVEGSDALRQRSEDRLQ